jgi:aromatic-L-amino-acid decarboxylase
MHAIAAARENTGLDIRKKGMSGIPKLRLYCTQHTHSSIEKGALTLGIGLDGVRKIPVDPEFRMIPAELEKAIKEDRASGIFPFCVVATIGTTSTTSIDPLNDIAVICKREKIWLHVDGAHAGVTAMLPEMHSYFKGLEHSDSFVVNPHKWLFVPADLSVLFIQKPDVLKQAFSLIPEYLKTSEDAIVENYMDYGIQLGRRFRALKFWFILRYFGAEGLSDRLRNHIRLGQLFAKWIDADHVFERLAPTPFSTVCFRAKPAGWNDEKKIDELNEELMNAINATGKVFLSHTRLNDKFTIRLVVSGIRMEEKHIALAWEVIKECLSKILNQKS